MAVRRYVILEHDWPTIHWDLLLDVGSTLRAWRLWEEPAEGMTIRAEINADHRRIYLDYEGEVSGGRGVVRRWDFGVYQVVASGGERTQGIPTSVTRNEMEAEPCPQELLEVEPCPQELVVRLWGQRWHVQCRLWRSEGGKEGEYRATFMAWPEAEPPLLPACDPLP